MWIVITYKSYKRLDGMWYENTVISCWIVENVKKILGSFQSSVVYLLITWKSFELGQTHKSIRWKKTINISVMLSGQVHGYIIHLNLCPCPQTLQNMNVRELSSNVGWMRFRIYWPQVKPVPRSPQIATITTLPML